MRSFHFGNMLRVTAQGGMSVVQYELHKKFPDSDGLPYTDSFVASNVRFLAILEQDCIDFDLAASLATVKKMQRMLVETKLSSRAELVPLQIELYERVIDELDSKIFWSLSARESGYYNNPRRGWEEIIGRFPDSLIDVEEASKCFALSRYPAAVFHSLQVVETGLIALGKEIGVTDPISGWTAVTIKLQAIQKTKYQDRSAFEQKHSAFLEQMAGTVEGLKNAWRNKVCHTHGKLTLMTADFSPEIAEEILFATRAFMRRLATDGPLASLQQPS